MAIFNDFDQLMEFRIASTGGNGEPLSVRNLVQAGTLITVAVLGLPGTESDLRRSRCTAPGSSLCAPTSSQAPASTSRLIDFLRVSQQQPAAADGRWSARIVASPRGCPSVDYVVHLQATRPPRHSPFWSHAFLLRSSDVTP